MRHIVSESGFTSVNDSVAEPEAGLLPAPRSEPIPDVRPDATHAPAAGWGSGYTFGSISAAPRLAALRQDILAAPYELCGEKSRWLTRFFQETGFFPKRLSLLGRLHYRAYTRSLALQTKGGKVSRLRNGIHNRLVAFYGRSYADSPGRIGILFAEALASILEHLELKVYDHELIVGNCTSKRIGAAIHVDYGGLLMQPEIHSLAHRQLNPVATDPEQIRQLQEEIFPFWFGTSVLAQFPHLARNRDLADDVVKGDGYVLTQLAGISHVTPDYALVLRLGFSGILARIDDKMHALENHKTDATGTWSDAEEEHLLFLHAEKIAAEAAMAYGERWRRFLLARVERETDPQRRRELVELADLFATVPAHPAQTFHQALQSLFVTHVIVHQESFQHGVSFGRLDQILLPYYVADLQAGRITPARAVELIGCFLGKSAEQIPLFFSRASEYFSGLSSASGITLGGTLADGSDAVNELSFLFMEACGQMRLRQPNFHIRVHDGISPAFMKACAEVLKKGGGQPAFFSDNEVIPALTGNGVSPEDAKEYAVVGCAEWGVPGKSFPAAGAAFVNLPKILLQVLEMGLRNEGRHPFASVTEILDAFRERLASVLSFVADGNNAIEEAHACFRPTPFLSLIVEGCLEKGKDVTAGGAKYNSSGVQGVGLADTADSIAAIAQLVFEQKYLDIRQLVQALHKDFSGEEKLRTRILETVARYGHGNTASAKFSSQLSEIFAEEVGKLPHVRKGRYVAGFWTMTTHQGFGKRTGALPSGRKSGTPLANGISPRIGSEPFGPTAALASAAAVRTPGNGVVLNQKLSQSFVAGEQGNLIITGLVQGHFAGGGAQIQFNILDGSLLAKAKKQPDLYRDLVVRISGYCAYFNDLSEDMKDELIARALHEG